MTLLVVALDTAAAARCAKRARLKGRWQAVTPDNYQAIDRMAVPREQFVWEFDGLPWASWELPEDMLDAIADCMGRAQT